TRFTSAHRAWRSPFNPRSQKALWVRTIGGQGRSTSVAASATSHFIHLAASIRSNSKPIARLASMNWGMGVQMRAFVTGRWFLMLGFVGIAVTALFATGQTPRTPEIPTAADVRAFGARGDGDTDDTAAIQRAIDSGIGTIRFEPGTYRLTKTIVIDLDKVGFTSLVGDGTAQLVMAGPGPA